MSLKPLLSFSSGELDPILHDNVTLEKFKKGLATARNVMIGKTGSIISRFARAHFVKAKNDDEEIKLFSPPNSGVLTEWGNLYVRMYDFDGNLLYDVAHPFTEADLEIMHFESSGSLIYIFVAGKPTIAFVYRTGDFPVGTIITLGLFDIPATPNNSGLTTAGPPTGYRVDYAASIVRNGQESDINQYINATEVPFAAGESVTLTYNNIGAYVDRDDVNELRVYRRPTDGGAYGFIGSSTNFIDNAGALNIDFIDLGGAADFTNQPPEIITKIGLDGVEIADLNSSTGTVYQQRLLLTTEDDEEAIIAGRPGFKNNFYRDFPYDADSALKFKSGTSGSAKVLRMIDKDGLIVFTSIGIYINLGILGIDNLALDKKDGAVIDETIPPLVIPGGLFFVDKSTNTIRQFIYSNDVGSYHTPNQSIFSDHLFQRRTVTSWAFQGGFAPVIIVTLSDGTFATFTYDFDHQMKAWTRHDSEYPVEQVAATGQADSTFFVTNKNGNRYIEVSLPRKVPADIYASNPEADKLALNSFMDAAETKQHLLSDDLLGNDDFVLTPVTPGDWEENLTLTCGISALFPDPGLGEIGTVFRFFDVTDRTVVDLTVASRTSDDEVVVKPSAEFPEAQASGFRMYETFNQVTGLDHLEGESVSVLVDGYVVASPNNDIENTPILTVAAGVINLPNDIRGAIIITGRPITADVKTLNVSTVEQSPVMIESTNTDKIYVNVNETRGLYLGNNFPEEKVGEKDGARVKGMQDIAKLYIPDGYGVIANRYIQPRTGRVEKTIPGDWKNSSQIALRQVDPIHFEILSVILDIEVLNRSDR